MAEFLVIFSFTDGLFNDIIPIRETNIRKKQQGVPRVIILLIHPFCIVTPQGFKPWTFRTGI